MWSRQYKEQWNESNSFSSKFYQPQCVRVYHCTYSRKNFKTNRRTFIYFCCRSERTLVLNFLALGRENLRQNVYFTLASLPIDSTFFIFLSIKFVVFVKWNRTQEWKSFSAMKNLFISLSANLNAIAELLRSVSLCLPYFFCPFIHITMNAQWDFFITAGEHLTIDSFNPIF